MVMHQIHLKQVVNIFRLVIVVKLIDGPFLNGVKTHMSFQNGALFLFFVRMGFGLFKLCMFCFQVYCYLIFFYVYMTFVLLL
jgi:hypothetical protein